jgi:hypothetical protein
MVTMAQGDCIQFMEVQDEPKCQYGLPFFVGLLYLNQNFTCLRNNLEFNVYGSWHYHHLQDGCETFIVQTMATILIVVRSLWTQSF